MEPNSYITGSAIVGILLGVGLYVLEYSLPIAAAAALVGGFGMPSWFLGFRKKRRLAKITEEVSLERRRHHRARHQSGHAARRLPSQHRDGIPRAVALRVPEHRRCPGDGSQRRRGRGADGRTCPTETNFFAIVINIQQKAGGNLAEALQNLSRCCASERR